MRRTLSAAARLAAPPLLACLFWAVVFRPLPAHMTEGIPFTAHHAGEQVVRSLVPGDHLQLLYHFWLTRDMLAGGTPWFHNLYEFNTGDDAARRVVDPGYVPFSLVYAALSPWLGDAAGWNLAQLLALLLTAGLLAALVRRHARGPGPALLATALALCLPYAWITLAIGSPTGFGMALVPGIALGLDIAVRDGRRRGGWLAGVALLLCYTTDLHCFFFGALLAPAWCLVAWTAREAPGRGFLPSRRDLAVQARALWPAAAAGLLAVGIAARLRTQYAATDVSAGRTLREVLANSPTPAALFGRVTHGADLHFRMGFVLLLALALAALAVLAATATALARRPSGRHGRPRAATDFPACRLAPALLLLAGVLGILLLGLGMSAPLEGLPLRAVRKLLPPYRMIRQPVKILCILPTVLAPFLALAEQALAHLLASCNSPGARRAARWSAAALAPLALAELAGGLRLGIATLPPPSAAHQAVNEDARARHARAHVLSLPLWPGDSAWSSLYEYRAMQGRIRMLNGYAPVRTDTYLDTVFRRFESVTQGRLSKEQADALCGMGVTAVVLHEDFPDVVSPFPVLATLRRLQAHPRLAFLAREGGIWSFALRAAPRAQTEAGGEAGLPAGTILPPARWWRWAEDPWSATNACEVAPRSPVADWPALRWLVRAEGDGVFRIRRGFRNARKEDLAPEIEDEVAMEGGLFLARRIHGPASTPTAILAAKGASAEGPAVRWIELPIEALPDGGWAVPVLRLLQGAGQVRLTDTLLAGGRSLFKQEQLLLPVADLFRGGLLELEDGQPAGVRFRPGFDPPGEVLYGPNLPLSPGTWRVTLEGCFDPADPEPATLHVCLGQEEVAAGPVGPDAAPLPFAAPDLRPLVLRLHYAGRSELRADRFRLERAAAP